ncbi:malate dehydrogenase (quinone) [Salinicola rhizosphaerae]|uniref:Probable malate:quinone oxidoreductase n=1 Tax=Salinicola rhizosphaerae TaxID=1443141 RepID=A0ABQ3EDN1_9GAMM|nr:malate dehydrogenase (quinone) [Salinicola rhizosphaerae]GHB34255.1 putative malate:quinone oxidoreductase [Salinicola rhizosphaerae]
MHRINSLITAMSLAMVSSTSLANDQPIDVVLIGGGTMSATLGTYLHELQPDWNVTLFERLGQVAEESSNAWNNSGSGHSAFCEMNYTPQLEDGSVTIDRAIKVTEDFEVSRQFWAHQVDQGVLHDPASFITSMPHMSLVWGDAHVDFLRKRYAAMHQHPFYSQMEYSEDRDQIRQWLPLVMDGADDNAPIAATRMPIGTEVNYGEITRQLIASLADNDDFTLSLNSEVRDLARNDDGTWKVTVADLAKDGEEHSVNARYVFIGAGGAALPLLQASGIPEAEQYAGFPVGGQFLYTTNPEVVAQHQVKAYGLAAEGSPPMSVPHMDARMLDGQPAIFFGPFATFSSKFLKNGSWTDLLGSMTLSNTWPMMEVGMDNFNLVQYLVGQVMQSDEDRMDALKQFYPKANPDDWKLWTAGQRVQIIKNDPEKGGVLQFGTEVVASEDGTMSALLGASPGASTAPPIMLRLLSKVFPQQVESAAWQGKLHEIIPSYGQQLADNPALLRELRQRTAASLELNNGDAPTTFEQAAEAEIESGNVPDESAIEPQGAVAGDASI